MKPSPYSSLYLPLLLAAALLGPAAHGRINVVTLPSRDSVQLTIYNSADLTLVKETRHLTLRRGINKLEFSWANTLIDPTSLEFRALTHADQVEVLDVSFPPRVTNTLEWRVQSEWAGEVVVEIRYFTSGISWSADYVAEAAQDEKQMRLAGQVRVNNQSGEDYENAQVRLVVGVIRLVEEIAQLAKMGRPGLVPIPTTAPAPAIRDRRLVRRAEAALAEADALATQPARVIKEELSEYFLYTVEGRDTIPHGWGKRLPSFQAEEVPIISYYKYEKERWDQGVMRYYRFTNAVASSLGKEPLPDGTVQAFQVVSQDRLYAYVGGTRVKYIPINETVDLELGLDAEVRVEPKLMNWEKLDIRFDNRGNVQGWTIRESWEVEVQNSKRIPVLLDIRRNFGGDWEMKTGVAYEQVDANKVKFVRPLAPGEKQTFAYELTTRHGINVTK